MSGKQLPPTADEAEIGVLGCLLLDSIACLPILRREGIGSRHFFDEIRGGIFSVALSLASEGKPADDNLHLLSKLREAQINTDINTLNSYRDQVPSAANLPYYLPDLEKAFKRRQIVTAARRAEKIAKDDSQSLEVLKDTFEQLSAVAHSVAGDSLPEIIDAAHLVARPAEVPSELIYGLLHRGCKMVVGGGSKSFKTWTLADLALSVSHGDTYLGFKTSKGRVLYVNFELQSWAFRDRLQNIARAKNLRIEGGLLETWNLRGKSAPYDVLLPKIKQRISGGGYALIILDPIYKMLGAADETRVGRSRAETLNSARILPSVRRYSLHRGDDLGHRWLFRLRHCRPFNAHCSSHIVFFDLPAPMGR